MERVVTISASYGAAGSLVAPALAERLGLAFVDRLLSADASVAAHRSAGPGEGLTEEDAEISPGSRLLTYLARAASVGTLITPAPAVDPELDLREHADQALADIRAGSGAVVLGRAGAIALADRPEAFHVRLDGPVARRVAAAAAIEGIDEAEAAHRQVRTDRARELWVKRLYHADPCDPRWYHLWLDTTVLGADATVEVILAALGRARLDRPAAAP
jgi:cytidylate kinase